MCTPTLASMIMTDMIFSPDVPASPVESKFANPSHWTSPAELETVTWFSLPARKPDDIFCGSPFLSKIPGTAAVKDESVKTPMKAKTAIPAQMSENRSEKGCTPTHIERGCSSGSSRASFTCGVVNGGLVALYSPRPVVTNEPKAPSEVCFYSSREGKRLPSKAAAREKKLAVVTAAADALRQAKAADLTNLPPSKKCASISQGKVSINIRRKRTTLKRASVIDQSVTDFDQEVLTNFSGFDSDDDFAKENKRKYAKRIRHFTAPQLPGTKFEKDIDTEEKDTTPCPEPEVIPESIGLTGANFGTPEPNQPSDGTQSIPILPDSELPVLAHINDEEMMSYVMTILEEEASRCKLTSGFEDHRVDSAVFVDADSSMTDTIVESNISIRDSDCFSSHLEADDWTDLIKFDNSGDDLLAGCSVDFSHASETGTLLDSLVPKTNPNTELLNELASAMDFMMWSAASDQVHDIPILSTLAMNANFINEDRDDALVSAANTMVPLSAIEKGSEGIIQEAIGSCSQDSEAEIRCDVPEAVSFPSKGPSSDAVLYQCTHEGCTKTYTSKTGLK
ncbi:hypothetical protein HDU83_003336 [Entophlyctis luteolus]|nr:hypothetical protein HDU83_003336 [Entophlyctis luteolus]